MEKQKILFYSHDTFGLGHIKRILSLSGYISRSNRYSILIVSGSGHINRMKIHKGIDYIKLPSVTKIGDDQYQSKYLPLSLKQIINLRSSILLKTALAYKPDLFVVDNVPLGLKKEALHTLEALKYVNPDCRTILTMRDVLDDSPRIIKAWRKDGIINLLHRYYDSVLVFGLKDIYDVTREYEIPETVASKFKFCGYIDKGETFCSSQMIRDGLNINGDRLVLVTAGGGGDGTRLVETSLQVLKSLAIDSIKCLAVLGPDFPSDGEFKLRSLYADYPNIKITGFVEHLPDYINASDLVISMGGYNTVCEILSLKKKAIIVPRVYPRQEQLVRARMLSRDGFFDYIHPEDLSLKTLHQKIHYNFSSGLSYNTAIDMSGLQRSAKEFDKLLAS